MKKSSFEPQAKFSGLNNPLLLAQGSMGEIYRVYDQREGKIRALKTLNSQMLKNKWIVKCLKNEYELARRFSHRNLIKVHRWVEEKGRMGFLMDYVDGLELKLLLNEKKLNFKDSFTIVRAIVDALHYLHTLDAKNWIIHCDIKPENVLIKTSRFPITRNDVVLVDYGTTTLVPHRPKLISTAKIKEFFTRQRVVGGSYLYMSPEQVRVEPLDPRSDLYSVGCLIYEIFSGRPPFLSTVEHLRPDSVEIDKESVDRTELSLMHQNDKPEDPRKYNPHLQKNMVDIIMRCLQKEPFKRYQTAYALASDLSKIKPHSDPTEHLPIVPISCGLLTAIKGSLRGLKVPLDSQTVTIGRSAKSKGDVTIPPEDTLVSSFHFHIYRNGELFEIEDLKSSNGTFVNDIQIKCQSLKSGDKIRFGNHVFRFEITS